MDWQEGNDGHRPVYSERLMPGWWVWLALLGFVAMIAVAYGYAFGRTAGWTVAAGGAAGTAAVLIATSPVIRVDERVLRAGRARLPLQFVGRVIPLDPELSREARTVRLDPAAYLLLRTTTSRRSVMVEVTDPSDPHPYWLFSAKHPDRVASAVRRAVEVTQEVPPGTTGTKGQP